jgi:biopolymer transport protein ExbD
MGLKRRQRVEPEFSLAAMIDVIFLLLMFFMLTSNFVVTNALNLQLPSSSSTVTAKTSFSVNVTPQRVFKVEVDGVMQTLTDPKKELFPVLQSKIRAMGKDPKDITLNVAADKSVPFEDAILVLDAANKLKIKTIVSTTQEGQ